MCPKHKMHKIMKAKMLKHALRNWRTVVFTFGLFRICCMASAMARTSDAFPPPLLAALSGRAGLRQDAYLHELLCDDFGPKEKSFGRGVRG